MRIVSVEVATKLLRRQADSCENEAETYRTKELRTFVRGQASGFRVSASILEDLANESS